MARTLLALIAGLFAMFATMMAMEAAGHALYPRHAGLDLANPETARRLMELLPLGARLFLVAGWIAAAFAGALVAAAISRRQRWSAAFAIGLMVVLLVGLNLMLIPHPWWMGVLGMVLPMPAAWVGGFLGGAGRGGKAA